MKNVSSEELSDIYFKFGTKGLCHFCEVHGPRPLFCTYTSDDESHTTEASNCAIQCSGCTSIGPETVMISKEDNGTIFCSRESVPNSEVTAFLRQAALRSITCEVSWSKDGGVVYFSESQGHVLSLMFHLQDTRARGLKRLFSIVVLMKDKMMLLNITPMLSEHMQKIAKELQQLADVIYDNEQSICSQRALRLNTGRNDYGQSRSLAQLTGDEDIYKKLHSHFTWMLRTGAVTYTESLYTSKDLLEKLNPQMTNGTIFEDSACSVQNNNEFMSLRELERLLTKDIFRIMLYCTLVGIHIFIKSRQIKATNIINGLSVLLPSVNSSSIRIQVANSERASTHNICILEETETDKQTKFDCKWNGVLPQKCIDICPTLMVKIEHAISNKKFNDTVLQQHLKSLQLEWVGNVKTLKTAVQSSGKRDAINKLKQILGVAQHDEPLVSYWSQIC